MKSRVGILDSIRVLEISHAIAGPTASQILSDYGAEVIKIEKPEGGDIFREVPGMGPSMFLAVNRGKKSIALDLKKPAGLELFYRLVKVSDVIIENMGPRVAERLGVNYQRIRRANPRAIYCQIESFGKGPYENIPAFDPVLQASVGIMSTTGFPPDKYARAGISVVDMSAGLHAVSGILGLLYRRSVAGKGGEVRVSLYDAASYFMSYWITMHDIFKKDTAPLGATHLFGAPYNLFRTKDGFVYVAVVGDKTWESFCKSLEFLDLLKMKVYSDDAGRVRHKKSLERIISNRLRKLTTARVVNQLAGSRVPFSRFNTVKSLLDDPHFLSDGILRNYAYSGLRFRTVVNPNLIDGLRYFNRHSPHKLGSDTRSILKTLLRMKDGEIEVLRKDCVIFGQSLA